MSSADVKARGVEAYQFLLKEDGVFKSGTHLFRCPLHDDSDPSLGVVEKNGSSVWFCHVCDKGGDVLYLAKKVLGLESMRGADFRRILEHFGALDERPDPARGSPVAPEAVYTYRSPEGEPLFRKVRYPGKVFVQEACDGAPKLDGIPRWPYNADRIAGAKVVVVVEGEKDAERVGDGAVGVTAPSSSSWDDSWAPLFAGKSVLILPDNDAPGHKYADRVARSLRCTAAAVRVLDLDGLAPKGDLSDWLDARGIVMTSLSHVREMWAQARPWVEGPPAGVKIWDAGSIEESSKQEIRFVWENILSEGGFSIIAAAPGAGKSTLTRSLGVAVVRGEPFLALPTAPGGVLWIPLEEHLGEVRRHLAQLGIKRGEPAWVADLGKTRGLEAVDTLAQLLATYRPSLVVIDPMQEFVSLREVNSYTECYKALTPVRELARETGAHLMLVHHTNKNPDAEGGRAILGSTALEGDIDTSMVLRRKWGLRLLELTKVRYGNDTPWWFDGEVEEVGEVALSWDPSKRSVGVLGSGHYGRSVYICREAKRVIEQNRAAMSKASLREVLNVSPGDLWRALALNPEGLLDRIGSPGRPEYTVAYQPENEEDPRYV